MADEFNGMPTIKDRILLALGALEGVPKRLEQINDKIEKLEKAQSDQQLVNEKIDNKLKDISDNRLKDIGEKINKTCAAGSCQLLAVFKEKNLFEKIEANTLARTAIAARKGFWKDKLIGMVIAIVLLLTGKYLSLWLSL